MIRCATVLPGTSLPVSFVSTSTHGNVNPEKAATSRARGKRRTWRNVGVLCLLAVASFGAIKVQAQTGTISTANLGANQVTLQLTSSVTGTGYFTLLAGTSTACGTAAQVTAGQVASSAAAYRKGSLPLTAAVAGIYTLKNLIQSTAYTVCFTPDGTTAPVTANVTTIAGKVLSSTTWQGVGNAGFSAGTSSTDSLAFSRTARPTWRTAMEATAARRR